MNQSLKDSWIAALRYGQYSQARSVLCDLHGGRCCLGVLCDVAGEPMSKEHNGECYYYDNQGGDLTAALREKFGLTEDQHNLLTCLNDSRKFTFDQIAGWIEKNIIQRRKPPNQSMNRKEQVNGTVLSPSLQFSSRRPKYSLQCSTQ